MFQWSTINTSLCFWRHIPIGSMQIYCRLALYPNRKHKLITFIIHDGGKSLSKAACNTRKYIDYIDRMVAPYSDITQYCLKRDILSFEIYSMKCINILLNHGRFYAATVCCNIVDKCRTSTISIKYLIIDFIFSFLMKLYMCNWLFFFVIFCANLQCGVVRTKRST